MFNFDTVNVQPVNGQGIVRITEFQYSQPLILYIPNNRNGPSSTENTVWINVQFNNYSFNTACSYKSTGLYCPSMLENDIYDRDAIYYCLMCIFLKLKETVL